MPPWPCTPGDGFLAGVPLASRGETTLIVSDLATRAAAAVLGAFGHTGISLGVAGPDPAPERVAAHMRSLRTVIRGIAADVGSNGASPQDAAK